MNWGACAEFGGLPPESNYLFMGDYVDRGSHGYEYSPAHPARDHLWALSVERDERWVTFNDILMRAGWRWSLSSSATRSSTRRTSSCCAATTRPLSSTASTVRPSQANPLSAFFVIVGCAGFYDECKKEYSLKIWKQINAVFDCLPFTAILEEKILCVHAGRCPNRPPRGSAIKS